ncbi:putative C2H2 finger domain protein [Aspergillus stella-maris]|uniref:putative C2H2 finger domain protein n=1 Tax=Aspergillus stella-maris TaxID=1810926 RepID=UPI003CCCF0AD
MTSLNSSTTMGTASTIKTDKTASTAPTETASPARIKCTFTYCTFFFRTDKEMRKHKATYPEHEYCTKCDEDFCSEETLLLHMIKSSRHIVCPVCGIEFGSEGGRDRHIRQFHRTGQNLTCTGCRETFRSASGLMRHIEDGQCHAISPERLLFEQSKKLMRREALEASKAPIIKPSLVDADDNEDGGVSISMSLGDKNREAIANQPGPYNRNERARDMINEHWPEIPGGKIQQGDLMSFAEVVSAIDDIAQDMKAHDNEKENNVWRSKAYERFTPSVAGSDPGSGAASAAGVLSGPGTVVASNPNPGALSICPPDAGLALERIYRDWDPDKFFDGFSGEYVCACGRSCRTKDSFEKHVLSKSHGSKRMQCPGCLKIFKSTAALIAHCESATTKCNVNETNLYAQIIDEVSGGMVQASGENEDGTIRYVAGEVDL